MSKCHRRKQVFRERFADNFQPPKENEQIVEIILPIGNDLVEVRNTEGEKFLISLPKKFRRTFWLIKGMYATIEPIKEGKKVKGQLVRILDKEYIREYAKLNIWPSVFAEALVNKNTYTYYYEKYNLSFPDNGRPCYNSEKSSNNSDKSSNNSEESSDDSENDEIFFNPNRQVSKPPALMNCNNDDTSDYESEEEENGGDDENSESEAESSEGENQNSEDQDRENYSEHQDCKDSHKKNTKKEN